MESAAPRIYIVDDEKPLAYMTGSLLHDRGLNPLVFTEPEQAMEHIRRNPVESVLLITDCIMGPMNGLELIEAFQQVVPKLRTILLSGTITSEFINKCQVQPDRFVSKPFAADTLLRAVDDLIQGEMKAADANRR